MAQPPNQDSVRRIFSGGQLLDQSSAKPHGLLDWSQVEAKIARPRTAARSEPPPRYDSGAYLRQCREEDPWPEPASQAPVGEVTVSECRFDFPDTLRPDRAAKVSCRVEVPSGHPGGRIQFRLSVSQGQDQWTDLGESQEVSLADRGSDQRLGCSLTAHSPIPFPEVGRTLRYKAEASSGSSRCESAPVEVPVRIACWTLASPEIGWKDRDMVPVLDEQGRWAQALGALLARHQATPGSSLVVFGHGRGSHARECSRLRAEWLRCLLERDGAGWEALRNKSTVRDLQAMLSGLAGCGEWDCDPGPVDGKSGPRTSTGIRSFEAACAERLKARPKVDGTLDKETWAGLLEALVALVRDLGCQGKEWAAPVWGGGACRGVYPNGADFPKEPEVGAELCLFLPGSDPKLEVPKTGKATLKQNPVEDPAVCSKEKLAVAFAPPESGWVRRVRLVGRTFDPNKGFLLPAALPGIRDLVKMHQEFPQARIAVVGHAESDETHAGMDIARHRAQMLLAFLRGDPIPWLACFGPAQYQVSRWGTREIQLMLGAVGKGYFHGSASGITDAATTDAVKAFQGEHGLKVDGLPGPRTREALVRAYLDIENTTLLREVRATALGCQGHPDPELAQAGLVVDDRRIEVFFFEKRMHPVPAGGQLDWDSSAYLGWTGKLVETRDHQDHGLHVLVRDERAKPLKGTPVALEGPNRVESRTDDHGYAEFVGLVAGTYALRSLDPRSPLPAIRVVYPTARTMSGSKGATHG